ncbi:unnamed protein product [Effrenium voratum]|nr:unnamed protein product [Effrenium voratum]
MLSFREALAEDEFPAVCPPGENDLDPSDCWDVDFSLEEAVRPEIRLYAGTRPDVTLCCNGRKLLAHRRILSEVSYFESLFQGSFAERGTDLLTIDEDLDALIEVIRWIYCRSATSDKDRAFDLLRLAEFYGIDGLIDHAARVLASPALSSDAMASILPGIRAVSQGSCSGNIAYQSYFCTGKFLYRRPVRDLLERGAGPLPQGKELLLGPGLRRQKLSFCQHQLAWVQRATNSKIHWLCLRSCLMARPR